MRITVDGDHWLWTGNVSDGYGRIEDHHDGRRRVRQAHRAVWELLGGDLPEDLHHRCPYKHCVNPGCLEPLTASEHTKEHHPLPPTCAKGHAYTEANTYWRKDKNGRRSRQCRRCKADRMHDAKHKPVER